MYGVLAVRANGSTGSVWRGVGVRTVHACSPCMASPEIWGVLVVRGLGQIASRSMYGEAVVISLARIKRENAHVVCSTVSL